VRAENPPHEPIRGDVGASATDLRSKVFEAIDTGAFDAQSLLSAYCFLLYRDTQRMPRSRAGPASTAGR